MKKRRGQISRDPREDGALCDSCPMKGCEGPVFGAGSRDALVAVVGEGPGFNEVKLGTPFIGQSGQMLDRLLTEAGLPRSTVWVDNATLEAPPNGNLEDFLAVKKREAKDMGLAFVHPVDACRPRLFRALGIPRCKECQKWKFGPLSELCNCRRPLWVTAYGGLTKLKVVIPVGNAALRALTGHEGITKWRGSPLELKTALAQGLQAAPLFAEPPDENEDENDDGDQRDPVESPAPTAKPAAARDGRAGHLPARLPRRPARARAR